MKQVLLPSLKATKKLAQQIARTLRGGEVLALTGPLGSGKTTFVQFLAKALAVKRRVRSPSFVVMQTYKINAKRKTKNSKRQLRVNNLMLCHVDAYRLKNIEELEALGLHDYLGKPNVITVIEWAEKIKKNMPPKTIWLKFQYAKMGRLRTVLCAAFF